MCHANKGTVCQSFSGPVGALNEWTSQQSMALLLLNRAISQTDTSHWEFGFYCMLKGHKLFSVPVHRCAWFLYCFFSHSVYNISQIFLCSTLKGKKSYMYCFFLFFFSQIRKQYSASLNMYIVNAKCEYRELY